MNYSALARCDLCDAINYSAIIARAEEEKGGRRELMGCEHAIEILTCRDVIAVDVAETFGVGGDTHRLFTWEFLGEKIILLSR